MAPNLPVSPPDPLALERWPLPVVAAEDVGTRYRRLVVDASDHPIASRLRVPGQYVSLRAAHEPAPRFFVIASAPHELPHIEFLVTRTATHPEGLVRCERGACIEASAPCGAGFGLAATAPDEVVVLVTGSGIAAVRPFIEARLRAAPALASRTRLFYGEAAGSTHACRADVARWRALGLVACCLMDEGAHQPAETRFVQEAWRAQERPGDVRDAHFLVCGSPAMQEGASRTLAMCGVEPERVHFNW